MVKKVEVFFGKDKERKFAVRGYEPDSNMVFYLYRRPTRTLLFFVMVGVVLFYTMELGDMVCYTTKDCKCQDKAFATFCWAHGTHTIPRLHNASLSKKGVLYPGVGKLKETDQVVYHWAYLWIFPYYALAYTLFRTPWWIWKNYFDGRRVLALMEELDLLIVEKPEDIEKKVCRLLFYFSTNLKNHVHNRAAMRYVFCEMLNFLNVLGQLWLTDYLLNREFSTYGFDVMRFLFEDNDQREDPMAKVFPKVTTCHMNMIGVGGNVQLKEGICILPMNALYEKIFVILWFWYLFLALASSIGFIYRALTIFVAPFRVWLLCHVSNSSEFRIRQVCRQSSYGDWLFLFTLKNVMDGFLFDEFFETFAIFLEKRNIYKN